MNEKIPQTPTSNYLAPKIMASTAVIELAGLGGAELLVDVPSTYEQITLVSAGALLVGAVVSVASSYFKR